jgi:signal transduction histidine kinase
MESSNNRPGLSESERFAALSRIGTALMSERNEGRLLRLIAKTAADLTGAEFAAFTLRPTNTQGELLVPSEGSLFHLAAVVGVTKEQEEQFRRVPLGGEGLLAPIFRYKVPVLVADVFKLMYTESGAHGEKRTAARDAAFAFAHGHIPSEDLHAIGVPRGHPVVRSFLGAPLLDSEGEVRGGLLLGHSAPDKFTSVDKEILAGLAAQAAVAVDNARLYHRMQMQAQELEAIFESIADGVTFVDPNGRVVRENQCAQQLRQQLERHERGRQALDALVHAPARSALEGMIEKDIALTLIDERGEYREFVVNTSPLHRSVPQTNGEFVAPLSGYKEPPVIAGAVVVWHDVTENRRILRERLIHAETDARRLLLQRILDELPGGVYLVHGPDARLLLANRAAKTLLGAEWLHEQPLIEFLQQNGIQVFRVDGRQLPYEQLFTLRAVNENTSFYQQQEIIRYADGSTLPVLVNVIVLDTQKFPLNISATEAALQEPAALVMYQNVSAMKEAEALKDDFIGIAAHELRNPLAVLQGFAQLLLAQSKRGTGSALTIEQQESLEGIYQATKRMGELTEDLLDVTRLQAGRLQLHQVPTDLVALVRRAVKRFQVMAPNHRYLVAAEVDVLIVSIDVSRVEQVINNIVSNAVKYSPRSDFVRITLREDSENNCAVVSIEDDGIGIPAQQQMRIFGRFVRADNARKQGIHGTGLGLYLSRELIERHGGRIWFQSIEGQGTTFFVALPLLSEDEVIAVSYDGSRE